MKTLRLIKAVIIFCLITVSANAQDLKAVNAMKKSIGPILDNYTAYSYPTNNYGIGTSCNRKWVPKGNMICDMIKCLGLSEVNENSTAWKNVNGFAFFGQGGQLTVRDSIIREYGVGLLLPKILSAINFKFDVTSKRSKSVKVTIDSAVLRYLDYNSYREFAESGKNKLLKEAWNKQRAIVVTSDYVLLSYNLEVHPVDTFGIQLAAKLDSVIKGTSPILSSKDSLGVKISKSRNGSYTLKSTKPVVFAVYFKKQKRMAFQGQEKSFDDWDPIVVNKEFDPSQYEQQ